jgi:hypothetical protein
MKAKFALFAASMAVLVASQASAQVISGSRHDLNAANDNNEVCVYCHTPHGARSQSEIEAPLWNKPASPGSVAGYATYDSTTLDGDVLAVGSVSIACLTCHDGTQATDAVINAPGRGAGLGFVDPASATGTLGPLGAGAITNLGTDLSNDHPIGIQYGSISGDPDFVAPTSNGLTGAAQRWWVDTTGGTVAREKQDMILYTRDNSGNAGGFEPFVECATCHDPHVGTFATAGLDFMRISNANSNVCLACHVK